MSNHALRNKVDNVTDKAADLVENAGETLHKVVDGAVERGVDVAEAVGKRVSKAADSVDDARSDASEMVAERVDQVSAQLARGKEATVQFLDDLIAGANNLSRRAGAYVRENPGKTFAAATVVTLVAATAIRRSRQRAAEQAGKSETLKDES